METTKMQNRLQTILNSTSSIMLFLVLKRDETLLIKKADIENGKTTSELNNMFRNKLTSLTINEDLECINLSSADDRKNAIYLYDYKEYPEKLLHIKNFDINEAVNYDTFSFDIDQLKELIGFIVYIGDMNDGIVCYKQHYPISLIKRGSFLLYKQNERFTKLPDEDILRLNEDIHLVAFDDQIFVLDISVLEKNFGFEELIRNQTDKVIENIFSINLVENSNVLKESCLDFSFSRKLARLAEQSLIITQKISNDKVIQFSKTHPGLKNAFTYSADGKQIVLNTKKSQKDFLRLLNDDFLISELTEQPYASVAKDRVEK